MREPRIGRKPTYVRAHYRTPSHRRGVAEVVWTQFRLIRHWYRRCPGQNGEGGGGQNGRDGDVYDGRYDDATRIELGRCVASKAGLTILYHHRCVGVCDVCNMRSSILSWSGTAIVHVSSALLSVFPPEP